MKQSSSQPSASSWRWVAAMRLASDNAHKLLDELTTQYNVARKHGVTQSLLEILTGYETAVGP
jgi:F0F1-type ATP synthase gamma subunit